MREVYYRDMTDRYESSTEEDRLIYTVEKWTTHDTTKILPGKIGTQHHRTMGHTHTNGEYEMYRGIEGEGKVIQIKDGVRTEYKLCADDRVDIEPFAYHYAENIGDGPLVFVTLFANDVIKDYTKG